MLIILSRLFDGKKPPEEINVIDKLNELKDLIPDILSNKKIQKVRTEYNISTLEDCFKVSIVLNDKKLVKFFFKLTSKISIKSIIENKKYKPPIHWDDDLHNIKLSSKCLIFSNTENPVEVNPETASKYAFINVILYMLK